MLSAVLLCIGCSRGEVPAGAPSPAPPPPGVAAVARDYWPTQEWRTATPQEVGLDPAAVKDAADYAFTRTGDDRDRAGIRTDGLLVVRRGRIALERYARGYGPDTPHLCWSVSKSLVNALCGIAVAEGRLRPEDPAYRYYPLLDAPGKRDITVDHLLHMSTGFDWNEGYEASPLKSSVIAMLYTMGHRDMARFVALHDLAATPGTRWLYSSGDTNLLSAVLRGALPQGQYDSYPWDRLFSRLGIRTAVWERDGAGTFIGSSYVYLSPRDLARLGFLYLNDGVWEDRPLLPPGWVTYSRRIAPAFHAHPPPDAADGVFGAHLWLNQAIPQKGVQEPWPSAPEDAFAMEGHWGQRAYMVPSLDLLVVRTGDDRDRSFSEDMLLKKITAGIRK